MLHLLLPSLHSPLSPFLALPLSLFLMVSYFHYMSLHLPFLFFLIFLFLPQFGADHQLPKCIRLVVDVSGSMYRFNGMDGRLERTLEAVLMMMEAFDQHRNKFKVSLGANIFKHNALLQWSTLQWSTLQWST